MNAQPPRIPVLMTVGHSNHEWPAFVTLVRDNGVTAIADVRSSPYSRMWPQYNRETLEKNLRDADLAYVFLGDELGARRREGECYVDGKARYERIVQLPSFKKGVERIRAGLKDHRIALLCAEKDPITCHRMVLVCREMREDAIDIRHIREDGSVESNADAERRMLAAVGVPSSDLFMHGAELIDEAYRRQGLKIAWVERDHAKPESYGGERHGDAVL